MKLASPRKLAPAWIRTRGREVSVRLGQATASRRPPPDFLVVGGQRCGTTSLFRALMTHPRVHRPQLHKGVNYFDVNYDRGFDWYRGHFPIRPVDDTSLVFDASGYYLFHPLAAPRIAADLPDVRIVAMVRDPVERAYSAYKHERARGYEWEPTFERALDLEDRRLAGEVERLTDDPAYRSFNHRHHAYRGRGEYAALLAPFVTALGRDRVHLVESERFFATPEPIYRELTDFLGLEPRQPERFERYNARPGAGLAAETRAELSRHFEPHDAALADLLGRPPVWREGT